MLKRSNAEQIKSEFDEVVGEDSPAYSTVAKWVSVFKRGEMSIEDAPRSGRPVALTTAQTILLSAL